MGGYGALRLAFLHPELFGSVTAQSAALIEKLPDFKPSDAATLAAHANSRRSLRLAP